MMAVFSVTSAGALEQPVLSAEVAWHPGPAAEVLPVPEPSRTFLLVIGIMAVAFTYRQAWMNLKRKN